MENRIAQVHCIDRRVLVPAALTTVALAVLWGWGRWWYLDAARRAEVLPTITAGWLLAMWVAASYATIGAATSLHRGGRAGELRRTTIATAAIGASCAALLVLVVVNAHTVRMGDAMQVYVLLLSWLALVGAVTRAMRFFSRAMMVMVPSAMVAVLMGLSVFAVPAVRWAGSGWTAGMATGIAYLSPTQALMAALRPSLTVPLPTMPLMYQLSPMGQDIPMGLPVWWVSAVLYGLTGAGVSVLDWAWSHRRAEARKVDAKG